MSPAALVRTMDQERPTLLLDEIDAAMGGEKEYSEVLRGILNEGFRRGGNFRKVEGKKHELRVFQVFGAKAIAGIGRIPETVQSRSLVIEMRRKTRLEEVAAFRLREVKEAAVPLVTSLRAWASNDRLKYLHEARPQTPSELTDRQKDMSEPLLAIVDPAGGEWPESLRGALITLFGSAASQDDSIGVKLLRDIRSIFEEREEDGTKLKGIHSADLAASLREREGQPWAEWAKGRGLDTNRLARLLKPYGISPLSLRLAGGNQKGYMRESFEDTWGRYCPVSSTRPSVSVTAVTTRINTDGDAISCTVTDQPEEPIADTLKPASLLDCDGVTAAGSVRSTREEEASILEGEL